MGEFLRTTPMFEGHYEKDIPEINHDLGYDNISFLLDGKDALMHMNQKMTHCAGLDTVKN